MSKYGEVVALALLLGGCAAQPIKPDELAKVSDMELCIAISTTYVTGGSAQISGHAADSPTLAAEAIRRGQRCEPRETYMAIAYQRQQLTLEKEQADAARSVAVSQALMGTAQAIQAAQRVPQPATAVVAPAPTQTICRQVGSTVQCSSY